MFFRSVRRYSGVLYPPSFQDFPRISTTQKGASNSSKGKSKSSHPVSTGTSAPLSMYESSETRPEIKQEGGYVVMDPKTVLAVIRHDPGMTSSYYAKKYFGCAHRADLNMILWGRLKKLGDVQVRRDGDENALWYPGMEYERHPNKLVPNLSHNERMSAQSKKRSKKAQWDPWLDQTTGTRNIPKEEPLTKNDSLNLTDETARAPTLQELSVTCRRQNSLNNSKDVDSKDISSSCGEKLEEILQILETSNDADTNEESVKKAV